MPKQLNRDEIRADIVRQIRKMGAEDYFAGKSDCPFGEKSRAAIHWREGFTEAERFPLLAIGEAHGGVLQRARSEDCSVAAGVD